MATVTKHFQASNFKAESWNFKTFNFQNAILLKQQTYKTPDLKKNLL